MLCGDVLLMTATPPDLTDTAASLMREVLERPWDDGCRKIYADYLDENGEPERAEYIRVQIELANMMIPQGLYRNAPIGLFGDQERRFKKWGKESNWGKRRDSLLRREVELWLQVRDSYESDGMQLVIENGRMRDQHRPTHAVVSRGFPSAVSMTLRQFMGWSCERCEGRGWHRYTDAAGDTDRDVCDRCESGQLPGLAAEIGRRWPVVEVTISDAVIHESTGASYFYVGNLGAFPIEYWNRLDRLPSRYAARAALSHACVDHMRERAGLSALKWSTK